MKEIGEFTPYQIDRSITLNRVDRLLRRVDEALSVSEPQTFTHTDLAGVSTDTRVNRQFAFGMYKVRKSLIVDLVREGCRDVAEDILMNNDNVIGRKIR